MKSLILIVITISLNSPLISQGFAPVGARWYYEERYAFSGDFGPAEVLVTKDTLIQGRNCVEIAAGYFCLLPQNLQYVNTKNDSVFFYDQNLHAFKLIYSFNTPEGGSWSFPILGWDGYMDTMIVTVNALSTIDINAYELTVQHVTYFGKDYNEYGLSDSLWYNSEIIESIGDLTFIFFFPTDLSAICDDNYSTGLRCYDDLYYGHYETGISPSCIYPYVGLNEPKVNTLGLYPNPTSNKVYLKSLPQNAQSIDLIDNLGKVSGFFRVMKK